MFLKNSRVLSHASFDSSGAYLSPDGFVNAWLTPWYLFTKWDSKYKNFKQRQAELERKIDEEPEDTNESNDK